MTKYHIYDQEKNLLLWYGCQLDHGYFFEIVDIVDLEKAEGKTIESGNSLFGLPISPNFYQILEEWEAPIEHLLAVSLSENF